MKYKLPLPPRAAITLTIAQKKVNLKKDLRRPRMKNNIFLTILAGCAVFMTGCESSGNSNASDEYTRMRINMIERQIKARGVSDKTVLDAMMKVERHLFVPKELEARAYADYPLPIGEDQTISQPYIVALMTELMGLKGGEKVLEIGTGSGYQAAVLGEICGEVYTIEIVEALAKRSNALLKKLGYKNLRVPSSYRYINPF